MNIGTNAERFINFARFILYEYKWALDPNIAYQLTNLVSEIRSALNNGDIEVLKEKVKDIEKAVNTLPELVQILLGIKSSIEVRIGPYAPNKANELQEELQIIERNCKSGNLSNFNPAILKLVKKMTKVIGDVIPPDKDICPKCNSELKGERYCSKCNYDTWMLIDPHSGIPSSSRGFRR
jgi:DNA repair exonuclease SbcCD ATPase subunit